MFCLVLGDNVLLADGRCWASTEYIAAGRGVEWVGCYVAAQRQRTAFRKVVGVEVIARTFIADMLHPAAEDVAPPVETCLPLFAELAL